MEHINLYQYNRSLKDIDTILLTHSHPDHIGSAYEIKEISNCKIYACNGEKEWIENINIQYKERPIPNFYGLLKNSVTIDYYIKNGDILSLEDGINVKVLNTKGH